MKKVFAIATLLVILASGICQSANALATTFPAECNCMPAPINDLCANAKVISSLPYTDSALDTTSATKSVDDPSNSDAGEVPFNSVWYVWTAPTSDEYVFRTSGSDYDTTLGIYTGACGGPFTEIASNDEDPNAFDSTSFVRFTAVSGTTYYIVAGSWSSGGGSLTFNALIVPPVPNPPTGLTATPISASRVDLSWTAPASGTTPDQYQILRCYGSGSCTPAESVALIDAGSTTYSDVNVIAGTAFRYSIEAVASVIPDTPSSPSNIATATTPGAAATVSYTQDFESGSSLATLGFEDIINAANAAGAGQGGGHGVVGTAWTQPNGNVIYGLFSKNFGALAAPNNHWADTFQAPLGGVQICVSFWTNLSATPHARDRLFSWGAQDPLLPRQGTSFGSPLMDVALDFNFSLTNDAGKTGIIIYEALDYNQSPNLTAGGSRQPVFASFPNALLLNADNNIKFVIRMSTFDPSASTAAGPGGAYARDGQISIFNNGALVGTATGMIIGNRLSHSDSLNEPFEDSIDGLEYFQYPHWDSVTFYANGAIDNINVVYPCITTPPAPPLPPTPAPAVAVPSAAPIACNPTVQLQNGGRGKFGCNIGGVGWSPTFTSSPGSVPVHPDPVAGELLSGKDCDAWVEVDVQT
jgi:hypothetical protein